MSPFMVYKTLVSEPIFFVSYLYQIISPAQLPLDPEGAKNTQMLK
jgi:hypothetical protein